ncbi:hypothetical protein llg_32060 [Luteolibacter sp. LG18]|nr:hypothetical protein llg_32060 [Luteolibacter sp. LG18]
MFLWLPLVLAVFVSAVQTYQELSSPHHLTGPDSGWSQMAWPLKLARLLLFLVGVVLYLLARPAAPAWKWKPVLASLPLGATLLFFVHLQRGTNFDIQWVDAEGRPLPGIEIEGLRSRDGLVAGRLEQTSDRNGITRFRLEKREALELWTTASRSDLQSTRLDIHPQPREPDTWAILETWGHLGSMAILMPMAFHTKLTRVISARDTLASPFRREQIRQSIHAIRHRAPGDSTYASLCGNIESIDLIADLSRISRENPRQRESVLKAFDAIQTILAEMESTRARINHARSPDEEQALVALAGWANVSSDPGTNPGVTLGEIEVEISRNLAELRAARRN